MRNFLTAKAVFGLFPAVSDGDDVKVFTDKSKKEIKICLQVFKKPGDQRRKEFQIFAFLIILLLNHQD